MQKLFHLFPLLLKIKNTRIKIEKKRIEERKKDYFTLFLHSEQKYKSNSLLYEKPSFSIVIPILFN